MSYPIDTINVITGGSFLRFHHNSVIEHLLYDSRKLHFPASSLFFALKSKRRDGHRYIEELYIRGVRNFIVSENLDTIDYHEGNFILVDDTQDALQKLAAYHRKQFHFPVIGITGSNGKTIVKEWLYQLLQPDYSIVRNPKSYNSQLGVPVSVWQMSSQHNLAIFEAGISQPGEMEKLETVMQPTLGVLTNIGEAHNEGFTDSAQKFSEKIKLFRNCGVIIGRGKDFISFREKINTEILTWGKDASHEFVINSVVKEKETTAISLFCQSSDIIFEIPFTDDASIENAITCCCVMLYLGCKPEIIRERMKNLQQVNMRLELIKGINHCIIINDSYSTDLDSLNIALNFLQHQGSGINRTVIISDFLQSGLEGDVLYSQIAASVLQYKVNRVIGIGNQVPVYLKERLAPFAVDQEYFSSTEEFLAQFRFSKLKEEMILVKGARVFQFENIVRVLEQKIHQTVLDINLTAIVHNLKEYQKFLNPSTKVMAMVKAFAYGSGGAEIAAILQYHKVDYLGVAYTDEGVELRKAGITIPIMVMNPEENSFEVLAEYNLEPELYSFEMLKAFDTFIKKEALGQYPVHLEVETGMNRLGFDVNDMDKLADFILATDSFTIRSVFSHLASAEDPMQDDFTAIQGNLFTMACKKLENKLGYRFLKHISNSAAIIRHPGLQMDMVRLGIGLYGIDSSASGKLSLQTVAVLKSTISQIKKIKAGDSVSYGRIGILDHNAVIATVRIGYADGFPRRLGNGKSYMLVKGKPAYVIGAVCMDMTMIDITNIPEAAAGDEVIIFGQELPVQQLAQRADTIPYEIMTGISQRVKRVYYDE